MLRLRSTRIAAVIGTLAGTLYWIIFTHSPWGYGLAFSAILGIVGQVGDLTESAIKRVFRVKDSGDIIPGHGGLLDRLDGFVAAIVFVALIGFLRVGADGIGRGFMIW